MQNNLDSFRDAWNSHQSPQQLWVRYRDPWRILQRLFPLKDPGDIFCQNTIFHSTFIITPTNPLLYVRISFWTTGLKFLQWFMCHYQYWITACVFNKKKKKKKGSFCPPPQKSMSVSNFKEKRLLDLDTLFSIVHTAIQTN